jgi:hypothetical protein
MRAQTTDDRGQKTGPTPATGVDVHLLHPVTRSLEPNEDASLRRGSRPGVLIFAYPCPGPARRNGWTGFTVTTRFTMSENRWQRAEDSCQTAPRPARTARGSMPRHHRPLHAIPMTAFRDAQHQLEMPNVNSRCQTSTDAPSLISMARARRRRLLSSDISHPTSAPRRRLVGLGRLERPTSRLSGVRSNQLSYRPRPPPDPTRPGVR